MTERSITIAGKELPLGFDLRAWVNDLEPAFGSLDKMAEKLGGQDKPITAGITMLVFVINAGYRMRGEKEIVKKEWLLDNMKPYEVAWAVQAGQRAITASFRQEEEQSDQGPVDVVLAELEKKAAGSA
jgi:hypothetical protein